MAPLSATLRGNVLFTGSVDDSVRLSHRGPGSYFQTMSSDSFPGSISSPLTRKSFNVRAQNGNLMGQQTAFRKTQESALITSPIKTQQQQQGQRQRRQLERQGNQKNVKVAWSSYENSGSGSTTPQSSSSRNLSRTPIDPRAKYHVDTPALVNVLRSDRSTPFHHRPSHSHPHSLNENNSSNRNSNGNGNGISRTLNESQSSQQRGIQTPQQRPTTTPATTRNSLTTLTNGNVIRTPIH
jgi:hypothetical protein